MYHQSSPLLTLFCLIGFAFAFPSETCADILALYDFESTSTTNSVSQGQIAASQFPLPGQSSGVSASAYRTNSTSIVNGATVGGVAFGSSDPHAFARTVTTPDNSLPSPPTPNPTYHEFTLDVNQGIWSFDSLHFEYWVNDFTSGQNYSATVYSGLTAGTSLGTVVYTPTGNNFPDIQTVTINDSNFRDSFTNLAAGTSVTFRLEFSDNVNDGLIVHRVDDVVVRGFEVDQVISAIPEPAAGTILLLIGAVASIRRHRN